MAVSFGPGTANIAPLNFPTGFRALLCRLTMTESSKFCVHSHGTDSEGNQGKKRRRTCSFRKEQDSFPGEKQAPVA